MKILIIGVSGFIGRELARTLVARGHRVTGLSRNPQRAQNISDSGIEMKRWDGTSISSLADAMEEIDGIVNLAGENIAAGLWTKKRKARLTSSRIETGRILTEAILQMTVKPSFLLQGSATGFYGPQTFGPVDEKRGSGSGFLADLVQQWESSVSLLAEAGVRVVYLRSGVVLDPRGGMLKRLLIPFDFYAGTILGNGKQFISWIHLQDEVNAIAFLVENHSSSGPYNLTSPAPATMMEMVKEIGRITRKPAFLIAPAFLLQAFLGQMARETILASQQVIPSRLLSDGFRFTYDDLGSALQDLLRKPVK